MRCKYLIILVIILLHCTLLCAEEIIWQVGIKNDFNREFESSGTQDMIIDYQVPSDWANKVGAFINVS